jgi:hypothetical protein
MKKGGKGGSKTAKNGKAYEEKVDYISTLSKISGYKIILNNNNEQEIYFMDEKVGIAIKKDTLYKFLTRQKVDWGKIISKKLLPDEAILNFKNSTLYIIEIKHQVTEGSVDEKLQTCDFKKKQFEKLLKPLNINVEYIYILNNWFEKEKYWDVKQYIKSVGCRFYFNTIDPRELELPQ